MNIDIKTLTEDWLKWATEADEHKKGSKDKKINSAFEEMYIINAAIDAGKTTAEVSEIFGAEFAKKYEQNLAINTREVNSKSDEAEDMQDDIILRYIVPSRSNFVEKPDWKAYVENLKQEILSPDKILTNRGYYTTLIKQIEVVADAMTKHSNYNSKDDINELYKKVKSELNLDNDKFKKFKLEVLKQMVMAAEAHQKDKEYKMIETEYNELRKTKSREEAVESIQKNKKFKGSYFHDYYGQQATHKFKGDNALHFYKGLIHQMEDGKVMDEARDEVYKAIESQRKKTGGVTDGKDVESEAIKSMGASYDKYAKKVFGGELTFTQKISFEKSNVKLHRKAVASDNRAEKLKNHPFTENEIKDELKNDLIFNGLLASGKITQRDEMLTIKKGKNKGQNVNTYDISNLSDMIRDRVGKNLRASHNSKNMYAYSEVENIVKDIIVESGIPNVTSKDAKNLIKLCGFEIDGKNWVKIIVDSTVGAVISGVSTFAAAASMPKQVYDTTHAVEVNIENSVHAELNLNITGGQGTLNRLDLMKSLKESGFGVDNVILEQTSNGFKLIIDKTDLVTKKGDPINFYKEFSNRAGEIALRAMLISFALNFMKEAFADYKDKTPITATQFKHTSIERYKSEIDADKKLTPAQKESLKELAEAFIQRDKDGNPVMKDGEPVWNVEDYKNCLDRIAGNSSFLEGDEAHIGIPEELERQKKIVSDAIIKMIEEDKKKKETPPAPPTIDALKQKDIEKAGQTNYDFGNRHTWQGIAAHYSECLKNGYKLIDIIHKLKDVNGIPYSHSLIPEKLYLPEILFEGQEFSRKKPLTEAEIKANDMKLNPEDLDKTTKPITVTLAPVRVDGGWKGRKTWPDGNVKLTDETFKTKDEAEEAAKKLEKEP